MFRYLESRFLEKCKKEYDNLLAEEQRIETEKILIERKQKKRKTILFCVASCCILMMAAMSLVMTKSVLPYMENKKNQEKYNQAVLLGEQGDYQQASQILEELMNLEICEELLNQCQLKSAYLQTIEYVNQNNYKAASNILIGLGNYKDSEEIKMEMDIAYADQKFENREYEKAITIYESHNFIKGNYNEACYLLAQEYLEHNSYNMARAYCNRVLDYKDCKELVDYCSIEIEKKQIYNRALVQMEEGNYIEAIELLQQLPADYGDVPDQVALCKEYKDISVD